MGFKVKLVMAVCGINVRQCQQIIGKRTVRLEKPVHVCHTYVHMHTLHETPHHKTPMRRVYAKSLLGSQNTLSMIFTEEQNTLFQQSYLVLWCHVDDG